MSDSLNRLQGEVEETRSAIDSAIIFIAGLANRLREALMGNNLEADISALADDLNQSQEALALAIAANTVAEDDSDSVGPVTDTEEVGGVVTGADFANSGSGEGEMVRTGEGVTGADSAVDTAAVDNGLESVSPIAQEGLDADPNTVGSDNTDGNGNAAA